MYIVISFYLVDCDNKEEKIHCLNNDYNTALNAYTHLTEKTLDLWNINTARGHVVKLLQISEDYKNDEGYCFLWPSEKNKKDTRITVIKTTDKIYS